MGSKGARLPRTPRRYNFLTPTGLSFSVYNQNCPPSALSASGAQEGPGTRTHVLPHPSGSRSLPGFRLSPSGPRARVERGWLAAPAPTGRAEQARAAQGAGWARPGCSRKRPAGPGAPVGKEKALAAAEPPETSRNSWGALKKTLNPHSPALEPGIPPYCTHPPGSIPRPGASASPVSH